MNYGQLSGVDKRISRIVMGTMLAQNGNSSEVYDDFCARGGNCFDTAHIYNGGASEKILGTWMKARGIREKLVIIVKGAHPPATNPEMLLRQFDESLDRLQIDYADIYFMHRDNTDIPVGEFVDALNGLKNAGRLRAFGGSNWTPQRFDEANAYAKANNKSPFSAVSNNFSLARMVNPTWRGCLASSDPDLFKWHVENQVPNFAWSSQARRFFVPGAAAPDKTTDAEMVRCWYSDDNFKRLQRCNELAASRGVHPLTIAVAYVLTQPFPIWSLVGPGSLEEALPSYAAVEMKMSRDEVKWLNLE